MPSADTDLYGAFTGSGIDEWNGSNWTQITASDPAGMLATGSTLYASFAGSGIYQWNGATWGNITTSNPEKTWHAAGSTLYASFAGGGIYQWNGATWTNITTSNPVSMVTAGSTLYASFAGSGIYQWNGATWANITTSNPESMHAAGSTLYASFAGSGIYQWNGSTWANITTSNPDKMVATGSTFVSTFAGSGIYQWNGSSWANITTSNPDKMVATGSTLYATFAGNGIYQWNGSSWANITTSNPDKMEAAGSTLYATFAGSGIYQWNGSTWTQITSSNPASMVIGSAAATSHGLGTGTASGTFTWNSSTGDFVMNFTSSSFPCQGPPAGSMTETGVTITATTWTWPTDLFTWTRTSGTANDPAGTWTHIDEQGNTYTAVITDDTGVTTSGSMSMTANIVTCGYVESENQTAWGGNYTFWVSYRNNPSLTSASVAGPYISGSQSLAYNESDEGWGMTNGIDTGSTTAPSLPVTYTFTLDNGSTTWTETATASCLTSDYPTNLNATSSLTPAFSWTGVGEAGAVYQVGVWDSGNNNIWNSAKTTGTSVVYSGPALASGTQYSFSVQVKGTTACPHGQSYSHGQNFTTP